jgi:tetraacyldisaccharide 4'-kinase
VDLRTIQSGGGGAAGALARAGLAALSCGYTAATAARNALYALGWAPVHRLPVRTVSIGNLVAGGTGKTPFTAWLASRARIAGRRPGILSRGYGPRPAGADLSDEGLVLFDLLGPAVPQVEDPDRVRGGGALLAAHPATDLVLLDDGFQHRRLGRDVDLVLLDATNPFGYGRRLPRGTLREPPDALARAHAVVLTRAERVKPPVLEEVFREVRRLAPKALVATARTRPTALVRADGATAPLLDVKGRPVLAYAGIGNPWAFRGTLEDLGCRVVADRFVPDHHALSLREADEIVQAASAAGAELIVTTRKDLVKWRALARRPEGLVAVDVETDVTEGADALLALVLL